MNKLRQVGATKFVSDVFIYYSVADERLDVIIRCKWETETVVQVRVSYRKI